LPGRRVRTTAQRPWIDWAYARSDRFPPRGVTPLTPIMGRATDPGENHDPGKGQFYTQLDPGAPIRERPRADAKPRSIEAVIRALKANS
jgi:hypothetical protein